MHLTTVFLFFSFSGVLHVTGIHSNDYLGQREAPSVQQRVQGLSQPQDGHYPPDFMIRKGMFLLLILVWVKTNQECKMIARRSNKTTIKLAAASQDLSWTETDF